MAVLGIFIIIATMFRSYIQPVVIMFTVPFGMIGAVAGHWLMGYDLSIMSIFGMVALTGVVVNDSLVLVDFTNRNRRAGVPARDAVLDSGVKRFRPTLLTSLTPLTPLTLRTSLMPLPTDADELPDIPAAALFPKISSLSRSQSL